MSSDLDFIRDLAHQTGQMLLEYFNLDGIHADRKADRTVVTEADLAADRFITDTIRAQYPDDAILSEEALVPIEDPNQPIWVVDPLDGTTNFSLGLPIWGVSIARVVDGYPVLAGLSFPVLDELYSAARGEGAWLNGQPIHTKPLDPEQPAAFFTCCTRSHRYYNISVPYKARILGAAAYDMCAIAHGASVAGFQASTKLWDIAAGWLLIEEAGGVVSAYEDPKPFPLDTSLDYTTRPFPTLMAADAEMAAQTRQDIQPKSEIASK
ncbi:MAG: hypothetical protein DWQ07_22110 [Chloroflexi bacterium]|nr:MAG: hypothetical protein DWQ07_22110 [Chloroflexota bacterium]MBL1196350.1 hypothetical protein [Chloroflexota bacterium]NOH13645.1 hypothetical protein [Chloroflexota bacterium]